MTSRPEETAFNRVITPKTGVSVALVVVMLSGMTANLGMFFSLRSSVALGRSDTAHLISEVRDVKESVKLLGSQTSAEVSSVRSELATLRDHVTELRIHLASSLASAGDD